MIAGTELDPTVRQNFERNLKQWKAYLMIGKGDLAAAREYTDAYHADAVARDMKSELKTANFYYGMIALKENDFASALSHLEDAGDGYMEWYYIGEALEGLGRTEEAREQYEKVATSYLMNMSLSFVKPKAQKKLEAI